jgi:hypothetical protein
MHKVKKVTAALFSTGILAAGIAVPSASAAPVVTGGLINVTLVDTVDLTNTSVQVPVGIAANVCDVNAAVLLAEVTDVGHAQCDATTESIAFAEQHSR